MSTPSTQSFAAEIEVAAKTTTSDEALGLIESKEAELVLVRLGGAGTEDALEFLRSVTARWPTVKKIAIARESNAQEIERAFSAGATAFVARGASLDDLAFAIKQCFDHSIHLAADRHHARPTLDDANDDDTGLSRREVENLELVAGGRSNGDVARELSITEQTVKFHLSNIYRKLDVTNRTQASRRAQQLSLVSLETGAEAS
jgi:DNA-binding NarL/FixJ family response regulator